MNPAPSRLFSALLAIGLVAEAGAAISSQSPFVSRNGQAVSPTQENTPIELRGVMMMKDGLTFGIYEPATQRGHWVKANQTGYNFVVRSYDAGRSQASVDYQGRTQILTLKEAKFDGAQVIAAVPPPAPTAVAAGQPRPSGQPAAPAVAANPAEEAKRLEQVANEVRRRRAARQAASQTTTTAPAPAAGATTP